MKKSIIACSLWFLALTKLLGQANENALVGNIPQESIYMHLNSSLLFSGEQFEYKIYCLNNATKKLSNLSKVAYVYLVDQDSQLAFSQKLSLTNGTGQGDFFIPVSLPTGSYKLFCLTQWMKNGSPERFFQSDIQIINPYRPIPEQYLSKDTSHAGPMVSKNGQTLSNPEKEDFHNNQTKLNLSLDKYEVGKRQKVEIIFSALDESLGKGSYSLSVRYCDPIKEPENSITSFVVLSL